MQPAVSVIHLDSTLSGGNRSSLGTYKQNEMAFVSFKTLAKKWVIYHSVCAHAHVHVCMCVFNRDFGEHRATVGIQLLILGRGSLLNQVDQPKSSYTRPGDQGWLVAELQLYRKELISQRYQKRERKRENFKS